MANQDTTQYPVFVYGTLRTGMYNHRLIEEFVEWRRRGKLHGYRMHSLGGFPGIVYCKGHIQPVIGEIMEFRPDDWSEVLARLDRLESEGSFYDRILLDVWAGIQIFKCWVYVLPEFYSNRPLVEGNEWTDAYAWEDEEEEEGWL